MSAVAERKREKKGGKSGTRKQDAATTQRAVPPAAVKLEYASAVTSGESSSKWERPKNALWTTYFKEFHLFSTQVFASVNDPDVTSYRDRFCKRNLATAVAGVGEIVDQSKWILCNMLQETICLPRNSYQNFQTGRVRAISMATLAGINQFFGWTRSPGGTYAETIRVRDPKAVVSFITRVLAVMQLMDSAPPEEKVTILKTIYDCSVRISAIWIAWMILTEEHLSWSTTPDRNPMGTVFAKMSSRAPRVAEKNILFDRLDQLKPTFLGSISELPLALESLLLEVEPDLLKDYLTYYNSIAGHWSDIGNAKELFNRALMSGKPMRTRYKHMLVGLMCSGIVDGAMMVNFKQSIGLNDTITPLCKQSAMMIYQNTIWAYGGDETSMGDDLFEVSPLLPADQKASGYWSLYAMIPFIEHVSSATSDKIPEDVASEIGRSINAKINSEIIGSPESRLIYLCDRSMGENPPQSFSMFLATLPADRSIMQNSQALYDFIVEKENGSHQFVSDYAKRMAAHPGCLTSFVRAMLSASLTVQASQALMQFVTAFDTTWVQLYHTTASADSAFYGITPVHAKSGDVANIKMTLQIIAKAADPNMMAILSTLYTSKNPNIHVPSGMSSDKSMIAELDTCKQDKSVAEKTLADIKQKLALLETAKTDLEKQIFTDPKSAKSGSYADDPVKAIDEMSTQIAAYKDAIRSINERNRANLEMGSKLRTWLRIVDENDVKHTEDDVKAVYTASEKLLIASNALESTPQPNIPVLRDITSRIDSATAATAKMGSEYGRCLSDSKRLGKANKELDTQRSECEKTRLEQTKMVEDLAAEVAKERKEHSDIKQISDKCQEDLAAVSKQSEQQASAVAAALAETNVVKQGLTACQGAVTTREGEIGRLNQRIKDLEQTSNELDAKRQSLQKEFDTQTYVIKGKDAKITEQEAKIKSLEADLSTEKNSVVSAVSARAAHESKAVGLQSQLDAVTANMTQSTETINRLQNELFDQQSMYGKVQNDLRIKTEECDRIAKRLNELEQKMAESIKDMAKLNMEKQAAELAIKQVGTKDEVDATLQKMRDETKKQIETISQEHSAQIASINSKCEATTKELDEKNKQLEKRISEMDVENSRLDARIKVLESDKAKLESQLQESEKKLGETTARANEFEATIKMAETDVAIAKERSEANELKIMESFGKYSQANIELEATKSELESTKQQLERTKQDLSAAIAAARVVASAPPPPAPDEEEEQVQVAEPKPILGGATAAPAPEVVSAPPASPRVPSTFFFDTFTDAVSRTLSSDVRVPEGMITMPRGPGEVASMALGSACETDREKHAPGCLVPIGTICATPEQVMTAQCDYSTVPLPSDLGNVDPRFAAMDIGSKIKSLLNKASGIVSELRTNVATYQHGIVVGRHFSPLLPIQGVMDPALGDVALQIERPYIYSAGNRNLYLLMAAKDPAISDSVRDIFMSIFYPAYPAQRSLGGLKRVQDAAFQGASVVQDGPVNILFNFPAKDTPFSITQLLCASMYAAMPGNMPVAEFSAARGFYVTPGVASIDMEGFRSQVIDKAEEAKVLFRNAVILYSSVPRDVTRAASAISGTSPGVPSGAFSYMSPADFSALEAAMALIPQSSINKGALDEWDHYVAMEILINHSFESAPVTTQTPTEDYMEGIVRRVASIVKFQENS